jgi:MFS family permease
VQRRTLVVVATSQVLGGAGLAAGVTVGALLAQQMLGTDGLAGIPAALFTLGSALTAYVVGRLSQRGGRRIGLGAGFLGGALGAVGVVAAAALDSVWLLFPALFVYGAGTATNLQARYAGTDLAPPERRGSAISIGLVSTTLGAVAGPNLVDPLGRVALTLGLPALAGPFLLAAVAYGAAAAVLFVLLRPDPLLLARRLVDATAPGATAGAPDPTRAAPGPTVLAPSGAYVGATVMVVTQVAMVAIMTMTPVQMRHHHHGLADVGLVIGLHIAGMYLPSPLTGVLVDRLGRTPMAIASGVVLLAAGVVAATAPGDSLAAMVVALVLLGVGWNLGLITGTALVVDATEPVERPRVQGSIDVLVALAGAGGGALSGVVVALGGYPTLALGAGLLALALVPVLLRTSAARAVTG